MFDLGVCGCWNVLLTILLVGKNMTEEAHKRFTDLKANHELLEPSVPATIYANLALRGISKEINGKYLRYNDPLLETYSK